MSELPLLVDTADGIARIRFNRPQQINAFNNELMQSAIDAVARLSADPEMRVIIVSGEGRAFSAGFDLKAASERQLDSHEKWRAQLELQFDFIMSFWNAPVPTIAMVHGYCLAGAFEASLACDMTICSEDAMFGEPEVRFGSGAVAMLFPWVTGPKQAKEIVLSGEDRIPAERALQMGLVNRVVARDKLEAETMALAKRIAKSSAASVRKSKQAINRGYDIMGFRQALAVGLDIDVDINASPTWEKLEFARIRKEQGVKAAIAWRDARFKD
ncbi:MAG: enoyl-CoA hydratase/isomerase family protein [Hyphomicrobiaceae bacterium]|nr:enoyl-CoA hydratase/isomerase family protein [Hyphomicrobiaceae bacterium]